LWAITDASNVVSQRLLYGEGVDQIQGRIVEAGPNAGTQGFYATDNLGSVRDIIDAATGEVLYHAEYDAFGGATEYGAGYGDTLKYTARELDADTGLQYNRARWYDNSVGRWLSEDPIGFSAGDHNLYRYVSNFATGATDPSGWYEERKLRADPRFRGLPRIGDSSGGHTGSGNPSGISGAQTDRPGQFPGIGQGGSGHLVRPGQPSYSGGNTQGIILGSPFMAGLGAIGEGVLELFITEQGRATLQWYLVEGLSVVPIIGDIRDVLEFVIGIDFATGEALNWWQRGLTLVGMVIPIIPSSWFRGVGRKVIDFFGGFFKKVPTGLAKPNVIDTKLQNIVNDLYKSGSKIGTGSTADAIRYERATGKPVGGKFHTQKGQEYSQALKKWLEKNPQAPAADRNAAQAILDDLTSALNGN
jgi:RHS repeat-associated protein